MTLKDLKNKKIFKDYIIRAKIDALLESQGKQWSRVYGSLGISKSHASYIRNGIIIPPISLRVAIARLLNSDTSAIWTEDILLKHYQENLEKVK